MIIHLVETIAKEGTDRFIDYYFCNHQVATNGEKITIFESDVTCKKCLERIRSIHRARREADLE